MLLPLFSLVQCDNSLSDMSSTERTQKKSDVCQKYSSCTHCTALHNSDICLSFTPEFIQLIIASKIIYLSKYPNTLIFAHCAELIVHIWKVTDEVQKSHLICIMFTLFSKWDYCLRCLIRGNNSRVLRAKEWLDGTAWYLKGVRRQQSSQKIDK